MTGAQHEQLMPAAQVFTMLPWHLRLQPAPPLPQTTLQVVLPWQSTVHPPCGHVASQPLFPVHDAVLPAPSVR
jgi:hypothetical protein